MILHRLGSIHKNQRGFTLLDLLLAMVISGIVTATIMTTIFQLFTGSAHSSNHMTVISQVQSSGYWVSHDAHMAQNVSTDNTTGTGLPLTLVWTEWNGNVNTVVYSLEDMPGGGLKNLQRSHSIDGDSIVAQYIDPDPTKTSCNFTDGELIFTVTATLGTGSEEESETRVYKVVPRPGS